LTHEKRLRATAHFEKVLNQRLGTVKNRHVASSCLLIHRHGRVDNKHHNHSSTLNGRSALCCCCCCCCCCCFLDVVDEDVDDSSLEGLLARRSRNTSQDTANAESATNSNSNKLACAPDSTHISTIFHKTTKSKKSKKVEKNRFTKRTLRRRRGAIGAAGPDLSRTRLQAIGFCLRCVFRIRHTLRVCVDFFFHLTYGLCRHTGLTARRQHTARRLYKCTCC
jgi:hypothetical protein